MHIRKPGKVVFEQNPQIPRAHPALKKSAAG
jgi:hypothetical protein